MKKKETPSFKLKPVKTRDDFALAFPVLKQLAEIEIPDLEMTLETSWKQQQKAMKESYTIYMAMNRDTVLGVVGVRILNDPLNDGAPYMIINNLVVEEDFRGLGIGTQILKDIREMGIKKKLGGIVLYVLKTNKRAKKLYAGIGFGAPHAEVMYEEFRQKKSQKKQTPKTTRKKA